MSNDQSTKSDLPSTHSHEHASTIAGESHANPAVRILTDMFILAQSASSNALDATLTSDLLPDLAKCRQFVEDMATWKEAVLGHASAPLLDLATLEYDFAIFAAARADYRSAFTRLRLFVELVCLAAYGSTHRIHLAEWLTGAQDTEWGRMLDDKEGILSPRSCRCFAKELEPEIGHIRGLTRNLYRDCSQFVHGNLHSTAEVPIHIAFDRETLKRWLAWCEVAMLAMTFILALRFAVDLPMPSLLKLRKPILDRVGDMTQMRDLLDRLQEQSA